MEWVVVIIGAVLVYRLIRKLSAGHHVVRSIPKNAPVRDSRHIPQSVKIAVSVRDGGRCRNCGSDRNLQYDHIYPWSLGGSSTDPANIQLLCERCNRRKRNRVLTPPPGYGIVRL